MTGWQVTVTEQRAATLAGADGLNYTSPPQPLEQARLLPALLHGRTADGSGPWQHPIAGGPRTIELHPAKP